MTRATISEREALHTQGYFIREKFFSEAEIAAFELDADDAVERGRASDGISKPGKIAFVHSGMAYNKADSRLMAFSTQPKVAHLARSIIGPRAAFFCYQLVYKYGHNPDPFPWHQDDSYSQSSRGYFSMWIAISDATIENGCLWVHPGRSLNQVFPYQKSELGNTCWPLDHLDQGIPLELQRGSAVIFSSTLMHKSGGNNSPHTRKGHIIAMIDRDSTIQGHEYSFPSFVDELPAGNINTQGSDQAIG